MRDGVALSARVVAWDEEHDLAILELSEPVPHMPLQLAKLEATGVGDPVAAMGNPMGARWRKAEKDKPVWAISQGVIAAPPGDFIQTDAAVNHGNSGGPLLTPRGRVVGVVSFGVDLTDGIAFAVSSRHLAVLEEQLDGAERSEYRRGKLSLDGGIGWLVTSVNNQSGVLFMLRGVWDERFNLELRLGITGGTEDTLPNYDGPAPTSWRSTERARWLSEASISYRFASYGAFGIPIGVGVAWFRDTVRTTEYLVGVPETCGDGCALPVLGVTERSEENKAWGLLSAAIEIRPLEIGVGIYVRRGDGLAGRFHLGAVF